MIRGLLLVMSILPTFRHKNGPVKYFLHTALALSIFSIFSTKSLAQTNSQQWYFDQTALVGSSFGSQISKFNEVPLNHQHQVDAGQIIVDVSLNGTLIMTNHLLKFIADENNQVQPCIDHEMLQLLQIKSDQVKHLDETQSCYLWKDLKIGGDWEYQAEHLKLNLVVPQSLLVRNPRGFIPSKDWDTGITALWLQHNTNYYHAKSSNTEYDYLWSSINSGINLGEWQLRSQAYARYLRRDNGENDFNWENNRTWLSKKIAVIDSELTLGDAYTDAGLFGSTSFTGIKLATDKRMWPNGKLGYAPVVRGVAKTTSQVIIQQNGKTIYETTVSPGPFVINDLYDTNNQGDISVAVIGNDGITENFVVPYSHLSTSMRPGTWNYTAALGKVRDISNTNAKFMEGTLQGGINNQLTANSGVRFADNYLALLAGGIWGTQLGAFGLNTTWSSAKLADGSSTQGWRAEASYSKVFPYGTNLMLAAYRFSTEGFRDLQDILGERSASEAGTTYSSYTLNQRNRLTLSLNQNFDHLGSISVSASTADYYNNQSRETQFQLNYSKVWKNISFNLGATRQLVKQDSKYYYFDNYLVSNSSISSDYNETNYYASVTIPFDWRTTRANATVSLNQGKENSSTNLSIGGTTGSDNRVSWSVNTTQSRYDSSNNTDNTLYWGGSLQGDTRFGGWRATYTQGSNDSQQYGLGLNGSMLLHSGGLTLGPWSTDTLALIEAKGAQGATVENGRGATIGKSGYALLTTLTPYRYNNISLNTRDMSLDTELEMTSQRVVPYAGAFIKVKFDTVQGHATLISAKLANGHVLPMGADVMDEQGKSLGMVGQGGQLYVRLSQSKGDIRVQLDDDHICHIPYDLSQFQNKALTSLELVCVEEN